MVSQSGACLVCLEALGLIALHNVDLDTHQETEAAKTEV